MKTTLILTLLCLLSCSSETLTKIAWDGELIKETTEKEYIYWKDGSVFYSFEKEGYKVEASGFEYEEAIFILLFLKNDRNEPFHFDPQHVEIEIQIKGQSVKLLPTRNRNLESDRFSFLNTLIEGTGTVSKMFINLPINIDLAPDKKKSQLEQEIDGEMSQISSKIVMSRHTLFPHTRYGGFLIFEIGDDEFDMDQPIKVTIQSMTEFSGKLVR